MTDNTIHKAVIRSSNMTKFTKQGLHLLRVTWE